MWLGGFVLFLVFFVWVLVFFFSSKYPGRHYWSAAYPLSEIMGLRLEADPEKGWVLANQAEHSSHSCNTYLDDLSWWPQEPQPMRCLSCFTLRSVTLKCDKFLVSWCYLFLYGRANSSQSKSRLITDGIVTGGLCAQPLVPWECFQSICSCCEWAAAVAVAVHGGGLQDCRVLQTSCSSGCCGCSGASLCSNELCWKCLSFTI